MKTYGMLIINAINVKRMYLTIKLSSSQINI